MQFGVRDPVRCDNLDYDNDNDNDNDNDDNDVGARNVP
jgi:hypothetical protein